ncbi:MAG TPA: 2-C-methyl-D-erythritol 4-phosphate cytidylyltransferase, partial [Thermoanaerobaculia bacterium]|nr:2-C-methyl-D-erythritol 4-phosphate cytidylyltransferase [Thermoanaerobaculia bacterium]
MAAGSGTRLGRSEPKALVPLMGRPLVWWTLDSLSGLDFGGRVIAAPPGRVEEVRKLAGEGAKVVEGGATRSESVRRAFQACGVGGSNIICIHDAARPFVTAAETAEILLAAEETGAAIAATPLADTIKQVQERRITGTLDRSALWAAATPQAFRAEILARALESGADTTDEAALCETLGIPVAVVAISRLGFKITTPEDLQIAEAI